MQDLPIQEGQLVAGKYRIERVIGSGAMGVVVAAWHVELAQRVAVKFVRPEAMELRDAEERFRREARAAARIRSEHVGRVMDVGVEEGIPYIVMEFLEGGDLADEILRRGPLPVSEATTYVLEAIEALAEAHTAGIIHRDLKPANLFLARRADGTRSVKILDFGVSKATGVRPGDMALTQHAAMIGSPLYMSPEQMRSARDVDARADIWSLGIILFELVGGRPPYMGDSIPELVSAMMEPPRSLRVKRPDVPESFDRVVRRCLERDPNMRYPDVASLALALVEFAPESRLHAERARRVMGGAPLPVSESTSQTIPVSAPLNSVGRRTVAAWGESQAPGDGRSMKRPLIIGAALLLLLAGVGAGFAQASKSAASASASLSPAPSLVAVMPAVPAPAAAAAVAVQESASTAASAVQVETGPSAEAVASAAKPVGAAANAKPATASAPLVNRVATKSLAARRAPAPAEAPPVAAPHPAPKDELPDFGGRR